MNQVEKTPKVLSLIIPALIFAFWQFGALSASAYYENLIANPSVENSATTTTRPQFWSTGNYGKNKTVFTYPTIGNGSEKGLGVEITEYTGGDAKWYFDDVAVKENEEYTFSDYYKATTDSYLIARFKKNNGSYSYISYGKIASTTAWTKKELSFKAPVEAQSVTFFHLIKSKGSLITDDYSIVSKNQDITAPEISITNPINNSTASQTIAVEISASDNDLISEVAFFVDTIQFGIATSTPYNFLLDSKTLNNGQHSLIATAKDRSGNFSTSSQVIINVTNEVDTNLISNSSLENQDLVSGLPTSWKNGSWGSNDAIFTYPVEGKEGGKATQVNINNYTDGDAKWIFNDVPVSPLTSYKFSTIYKSTTKTTLTARFTYSDGSVKYYDLSNLPASNDWTNFSTDIYISDNIVSLTVFHLLNSAGSLTTDSVKLVLNDGSSEDPYLFNNGMVSLTFDDGWISHYKNTFPLLSEAGLKGSFYIITKEMLASGVDNRISNFNLEIEDNGKPQGWLTGSWGVNNAVFTYPVIGHNNSKATQVEISDYTSGDAKWYFGEATVMPNQDYIFSDFYLSDVSTKITIRYTFQDGTVKYDDLGILEPSDTWKEFKTSIGMPANITSVTIFHLLNKVGKLVVDDYSLERDQPYMSVEQVRAMSEAGNEIGSHTQTHPHLSSLSEEEMKTEILSSKNDLLNIGITPVSALVYPYGDYNESVKQAVIEAGYTGARTVEIGFNKKNTDPYALKTQYVVVGTSFEEVKNLIDTALNTKQWLILMFHQVDNEGKSDSTTPETMKKILDYLKEKQTEVVTMAQGVEIMSR